MKVEIIFCLFISASQALITLLMCLIELTIWWINFSIIYSLCNAHFCSKLTLLSDFQHSNFIDKLQKEMILTNFPLSGLSRYVWNINTPGQVVFCSILFLYFCQYSGWKKNYFFWALALWTMFWKWTQLSPKKKKFYPNLWNLNRYLGKEWNILNCSFVITACAYIVLSRCKSLCKSSSYLYIAFSV